VTGAMTALDRIEGFACADALTLRATRFLLSVRVVTAASAIAATTAGANAATATGWQRAADTKARAGRAKPRAASASLPGDANARA